MINTLLKPLFDVKLIVNGKSHFYQFGDDEKWHPGVTTVLSAAIPKPALVQWGVNTACDNFKTYLLENALNKPLTKDEIEKAYIEGKNIYKKKSQEATDIGTRVHGAINQMIHGEVPIITEDIRAGVEGFLQWKASHNLRIELGDTKLGSKLFGFGGSMDFLAFDGEEPIIFDIKTNKKRKDRDHGIYPETALQLSSYAVAFRETYGLEVKSVYALWLDKETPGFKAVKVSSIDKAFESFLACLKLYHSQKLDLLEEEPIV